MSLPKFQVPLDKVAEIVGEQEGVTAPKAAADPVEAPVEDGVDEGAPPAEWPGLEVTIGEDTLTLTREDARRYVELGLGAERQLQQVSQGQEQRAAEAQQLAQLQEVLRDPVQGAQFFRDWAAHHGLQEVGEVLERLQQDEDPGKAALRQQLAQTKAQAAALAREQEAARARERQAESVKRLEQELGSTSTLKQLDPNSQAHRLAVNVAQSLMAGNPNLGVAQAAALAASQLKRASEEISARGMAQEILGRKAKAMPSGSAPPKTQNRGPVNGLRDARAMHQQILDRVMQTTPRTTRS